VNVVVLRYLTASGLATSVVGAALDFLSSYQMIYNKNGMMMPASQFLLGVGLSLLGLVVLVTGLVSVWPRTNSRMGLLGLLMEVYGVLMGLAGTYSPGMNAALADGMFVVGGIMFLNGLLMQWRKKKRKKKEEESNMM
jgi:hypothetical protein